MNKSGKSLKFRHYTTVVRVATLVCPSLYSSRGSHIFLFTNVIEVRSVYSTLVETDLYAGCHTFTLHVHAWGKQKRLCVLVEIIFSLVLPFGAIMDKNCFVKRATHL